MIIIPQQLGLRVRWYRARRGLKQIELAERVGVSAGRLSTLERGVRQASAEEVQRLSFGLRVRPERLLVGTDWGLDNREMLRENRRLLELHFTGRTFLGRDDYVPPSDRPFRMRLRAARRRWLDVTRPLEERIGGLPEYDVLRLFLRDIPCDSADEALVSLRGLAEGGAAALVAPLHLGFDLHFVIDPRTARGVGHCQVPAILLPFQSFECVLIPQVHVRINGTPYALDFLAGCRVGHFVEWAVVEIDGNGHDPRQDEERTADLKLSVVRFGPDETASPDFLQRLENDLATAIFLEVRKIS